MLYKAEGLGMLTLHLEHPSKVVSWHGEEIGVIDITELCLSAGFSDCLWSRAAELQSGRREGEASRTAHLAYHGTSIACEPSRSFS